MLRLFPGLLELQIRRFDHSALQSRGDHCGRNLYGTGCEQQEFVHDRLFLFLSGLEEPFLVVRGNR